MCTSSQMWPSRSSNPWPYMKPWSWGALGVLPPAFTAFDTRSSTFCRLSHDRQTSTSVDLVASATGFLVKVWKYDSASSITKMVSLTTMHSAVSFENCGLKLKPRLEKNAFVRSTFLTGRLMNTCWVDIAVSLSKLDEQ